ncbi:hypothetical protein GCM10028805_22410 [Spirosoma harenae]
MAAPFSWIGALGATLSETFTIDAGWPGAVTVRAYDKVGEVLSPLPYVMQPTPDLQGASLIVTFSPVQSKKLSNKTWIEIRTGSDVRFADFLYIDRTAPGTVLPTISVNNVQGLPAQLASMSSELSRLDQTKINGENSVSANQTAQKATGNTKKLIWETVGNASTIKRYDPAALEKVEDVFTSKN